MAVDNKKPQILLTNDDGIESPGLWAAAEALSDLGYVWVAAPREQKSGMGRSMPADSDGRITRQLLTVHGQEWTVFAVGGSPAQTVLHSIYEIMDQPPDLVVSGINYGLNLALGMTMSGTVGAAIEAAVNGIPAIAISRETAVEHYLSNSAEVDFSTAAYFTKKFASHLLQQGRRDDYSFLKIEVPMDATPDTEWAFCRLSLQRFYKLWAEPRDLDRPGFLHFAPRTDFDTFKPGTDVYTAKVEHKVAVTPITLDMTARVDFEALRKDFEG
ncbi:MAG: 5'/3'-nucleotidase SurE [Anaerolineales bacterium]|nr:5'/3'-nucleotidase SurE [Anaerolineales bacterium]